MVAPTTTPLRTEYPTTPLTLPPDLAALVERKARIERCSQEAVIRFCIDMQLGRQNNKDHRHELSAAK